MTHQVDTTQESPILPEGNHALDDARYWHSIDWATAEALAYYGLLKDRFNVQIKVAKPKDALAE